MAKIKGWKKYSERKNFIAWKTVPLRIKEIVMIEGSGKDKNKWQIKIIDLYNGKVITNKKGLTKSKAMKCAQDYMKKHPRG